ncbi:hypothetical protein SERN_1196 [Serinibacter arcticus]|uniref:Uncharacterized protein n=1 Tax=Serinibacter arcticus TaxID=1655435 RepID=A0A4Z1E354_9MICO|nr:hypothetical protein SERN_1196 [Serinibacter arcticus]
MLIGQRRPKPDEAGAEHLDLDGDLKARLGVDPGDEYASPLSISGVNLHVYRTQPR